jgi:hypothetical protein
MGEAKRRKQSDPNYGKPIWQHENRDLPPLVTSPDYEHLIDLYLKEEPERVLSEVFDWLLSNGKVYGENSFNALQYTDQIIRTVYELAAKRANTLRKIDLKLASFNLNVPFELSDYGSYEPVINNRRIAEEAMRLLNTGFFDTPITMLINLHSDAVGTLRNYGIVLYMGTNIRSC